VNQVGSGDDGVPGTEQTVAETAESLLAFENAALPLCVVQPTGTVLMVNRALRDLLGYAHDDVVGSPWERFIADDPDDVVGQAMAQPDSGELVTPERRVAARRSDGSSVWVRTSCVLVPDDRGAIRYMVARVTREPEPGL
jgi:PAS domain S-box-containing protein